MSDPFQRDRLTDPQYLRFQYGDDERLRVRIETHARYSERRDDFFAWVVGHVKAAPGGRVLDVGSGPGDYHSRLAHARVVAVDLSAGMLARVRVPAARADAEALPFRDRAFDRVMANYVLHHMQDVGAALREMRRVARTGGRVVITANGRDNLAPLFDLQNAVARELGVAEEHSVGLRFGIEDLEVVRSVLPHARLVVRGDALVFPSIEPILACVASFFHRSAAARPARGVPRSPGRPNRSAPRARWGLPGTEARRLLLRGRLTLGSRELVCAPQDF